MAVLNTPAGSAHARILGVGSYRPSRVIPNSDLVEAIESSDEWIRTRSGITERRWANDEETVAMMSVAAARTAIERAGLVPSDIDGVLVATVSHMKQTPAIATQIADELGTDKPAAFDISAACAGFCYGIGLASDMVRGGSARHVLVIGVERLSDITDINDRGSAFIFADGAGAVVVGPSETPGIGPVAWGSSGDQADLITMTDDWLSWADSDIELTPRLTMQGNKVFRWAGFAMAEVAHEALELAGIKPEDLDIFVPHQANMRITDALAKSMKLPEHVKIARDIATMGNTSAASVPLALDRMLDEGQAKSGDLALFIAFGAGLVYAAQVVVVP
ncbi:beta-ketoacyl-ACP synthase III [Nocardioides insulae]|uniref:beta-ketoacyl-ACP synthase III n=1 Tax=Nocardioides insulae TaxID=394734 RepID=UPI000406195B|nr:beta-ketoacyl-ACP synthase III [Nocardioides insulae]